MKESMRGFTLLEVLVALAILAVTLAAASRGAAMATGAAHDARLRLLATWIAENRIAERQARRDFPDYGTNEGKAFMGGESFTWRETVSSTPNAQFHRIEVAVSLLTGGGEPLAKLTAFLGR